MQKKNALTYKFGYSVGSEQAEYEQRGNGTVLLTCVHTNKKHFFLCKQSADTDIPLNYSWSLTRKQIQVHRHNTYTNTDAHTHTHAHIQMEADSMLWANGLK